MKCERVGAEVAKNMALAWALYNEEAAVAELRRFAAMEGEGDGDGEGKDWRRGGGKGR